MIGKVIKHRIILLILGVFLIALLCDLYLSNYFLVCTEYIVRTSNINSKIRIIQLTDLHNSTFGKENERLIRKVEEQTPDLICITGDLLNMEEENVDIATNLISKLSSNYPVYVSLGNHELGYKYAETEDLIDKFEDAGACVLDFDYKDININGENIRIGGLYGYDLPETNEVSRDNEAEFLSNFQNTKDYKILLTHMPYGWYQAGSLDYWDVDLVLTGHTHGGQVRIPFLGGLYAPDIGWFPGREMGLYYSEDMEKVMVLSRGLGSTEYIPRFNNIPEIVVVDVLPG